MRWNPRICERALRKQEQKKKEGAGTVLWGGWGSESVRMVAGWDGESHPS